MMLEDKTYKVKLKCVFCKSDAFELPFEGYQPKSGDMIKCANCGQVNDFTSINNLAINKTFEKVEKDIVKDTEDELMKIFKKAGFKIK